MNMYQTTFKGHAGASPLGGRKKISPIFLKKRATEIKENPPCLWFVDMYFPGRKPWQK